MLAQAGRRFGFVGVGADQHADGDAIDDEGRSIATRRRPAFDAADRALLAIGAAQLAVAVDDGDAVVQLVAFGIALGKADEQCHPVVAGDGGQLAHPGVGIGRDPVGADALGEVVAGFGQFGRDNPVGSLANRLADTGLDAVSVAGDVTRDRIEVEQGEAQGFPGFGRCRAGRGEALAAGQEETVLLAQRGDDGLVAGLADQFPDPAVAAGVAGLRTLGAGNDDDAVGAGSRRLHGRSVGAGYLQILQGGGLALGDGDQGARQRSVGEADVGQDQQVDGAGRFAAFDVGAGIDAGADGVGLGAGGGQYGDGQWAVAPGHYRQIVHVGGGGHMGDG